MFLTAVLGSRSYRIAVTGNKVFANETLEDGVYTVVCVVCSQEYVLGIFEVCAGTIGAFSDVGVSQQESSYRHALISFVDMLEGLIEKLYAGVVWSGDGEVEGAWCMLIAAQIAALKESVSILEKLLNANTSLPILRRHGYSNDGEICKDIARIECLIAAWDNTFV